MARFCFLVSVTGLNRPILDRMMMMMDDDDDDDDGDGDNDKIQSTSTPLPDTRKLVYT
jgi:hypothetical protein